MNLGLKPKFRSSLIGMAIGDAFCRNESMKVSAATQVAMVSAKAMEVTVGKSVDAYLEMLANGMTEWRKTIGEDVLCDPTTFYVCEAAVAEDWRRSGMRGDMSSGPMSRAIPLGAFFVEDVSPMIEMARGACGITHDDTTPQCATVAVGLMVNYAMTGIPAGLWASELSNFVSGLDIDIMHALQSASFLAGAGIPVEQAIATLGGGEDAPSALGIALFCCMRSPVNMIGALTIARHTSSKVGLCTVGSIVGACMAAKTNGTGLQQVPDELMKEFIRASETVVQIDALTERLFSPKTEPAKVAQEGPKA